MKVFNSRKDRLFKGIFYGTIIVDFIPLVMLFFIPLDESSVVWVSMIGTAILCFVINIWLIWALVSTHYIIDEEFVKYQFGPHKGKVRIDEIKEVRIGETQWAGMRKIALAQNGLIIKYKYSNMYISPISNEVFVKELLKVNPHIRVIE